MFRSLKASVLLIALSALGLAALPVLPLTQTASAELNPAEVETAGTLLGENSPELQAPAEQVRPTGGGGGAGTVTLTVPKLGLEDVAVATGASQKELDREGIIHLQGTGVPWQEGSNTFIVGHALGFMYTRVPYVFYVRYFPLGEESGELAEVGLVELRCARAGVRVVGEVGGEVLDQAVYPHEPYSTGKSGPTGILPQDV